MCRTSPAQASMSGFPPILSHSVAFVGGGFVVNLLFGSRVQCPNCEVNCGHISCPPVTCTTGSINFELIAAAILVCCLLGCGFAIRVVSWQSAGNAKGPSKGADARQLGTASSWAPITG